MNLLLSVIPIFAECPPDFRLQQAVFRCDFRERGRSIEVRDRGVNLRRPAYAGRAPAAHRSVGQHPARCDADAIARQRASDRAGHFWILFGRSPFSVGGHITAVEADLLVLFVA